MKEYSSRLNYSSVDGFLLTHSSTVKYVQLIDGVADVEVVLVWRVDGGSVALDKPLVAELYWQLESQLVFVEVPD